MKSRILLLFCFLVGCSTDSKSIKFSIWDNNGKVTVLSKSVDREELINYKDYIKKSNFRKLSLSLSNKDELIVEQKDEDGYLILVKIRYEQFVITTPLKSLDEVIEIMSQYLNKKDGIIETTKFY